MAPPRPSESCRELKAWYDQAIELGNPAGVAALRGRFAAFALTPVLTGTGRPRDSLVSASLR